MSLCKDLDLTWESKVSEIEGIRVFLAVIMTAHISTILLFILAVELGVKPKDYGDMFE